MATNAMLKTKLLLFLRIILGIGKKMLLHRLLHVMQVFTGSELTVIVSRVMFRINIVD